VFWDFLYLLQRYNNNTLLQQLNIIRPFITVVRIMRSGRPHESITHINLDASYGKAIRWLFVPDTPKKELALSFFKKSTTKRGIKERITLQKLAKDLRIGTSRLRRKKKKPKFFLIKNKNKKSRIKVKLKRIKKRKFWDLVRTPKAYFIAKTHKRKKRKTQIFKESQKKTFKKKTKKNRTTSL